MRLLSPEEVGKILSVSRSTARRLMLANEIPTVTVKTGPNGQKLLRVDEETLKHWIRSREGQDNGDAK
jgi:excisionase family DNA binding protein